MMSVFEVKNPAMVCGLLFYVSYFLQPCCLSLRVLISLSYDFDEVGKEVGK
jgi:hypothetical protein